MLQRLRERAGSESGFTLVELLVVMLILGILAAIAIPSFFNQRDKAKDASAKSMARTAETSMETYATDNGGVYTSVTPAALNTIEQTVQTAATVADPTKDVYLSAAAAAGAGDKGWTLTVQSPSTGNAFSIARSATTGQVAFSCTVVAKAGCPTGGNWAK